MATDEVGVDAATIAAALRGESRPAGRLVAAVRTAAEPHVAIDQVAAAAADGSTTALELLLRLIDDGGLARPAVRRLIVEPASVDDVVQETMIAVAERIGSFRGDSRFTTWLHQVARFKAIDFLRRQRDAVSIDGDDVVPTDTMRISSMIATRKVLGGLVEALPDHYRQPVVMRDIDQLPYEDIATRLDLPLNTVKSRIARGRAMLAGQWSAAATTESDPESDGAD